MYGIQLGQGGPVDGGLFGYGTGCGGARLGDPEGCFGIGAPAFDIRLGCMVWFLLGRVTVSEKEGCQFSIKNVPIKSFKPWVSLPSNRSNEPKTNKAVNY